MGHRKSLQCPKKQALSMSSRFGMMLQIHVSNTDILLSIPAENKILVGLIFTKIADHKYKMGNNHLLRFVFRDIMNFCDDPLGENFFVCFAS